MAMTRRSLPPEWQSDWMISTFLDTEGCINIAYWPAEVAQKWGRFGGDFPTEPAGIWGIRLSPYLASILVQSLMRNMTMLLEPEDGPTVHVGHRDTEGMGEEEPEDENENEAFDQQFWNKELGDIINGPMEPNADGY